MLFTEEAWLCTWLSYFIEPHMDCNKMKEPSTYPKRRDIFRYVLWLIVAFTAFSNRRHYRMFTTWLPHLATNSLSLLLPDLVRLILYRNGQRRAEPRSIIEDTLMTMVHENPDYPVYVTPLALGYIVSHPKFNIYKGRLGQMRFAGFGLDALPHSATAFALSALTVDTLEVMGDHRQFDGPLARFLQWGSQNPTLVSLGVLGGVTLFWEYGEYRMYLYEMSLRGDRESINMQWDAEDTARDIVTNSLGWAVAMLWNRYDNRRSGKTSEK
jgi:hypothetical protein